MESKKHRFLREAMRHYYEFGELFSQTGKSVVRGPEGMEICFLDLKDGFERLSPRKREAIHYNVMLDMRQKDVAEIMGITTVSVGQYVESGFTQFAEEYFNESEEDNCGTRRKRRRRHNN